MFGRNKDKEAVVDVGYVGEPDRRKTPEKAAAVARWEERKQAAISAVEIPEAPFRIAKRDETDEFGRVRLVYVCEAASAKSWDHPEGLGADRNLRTWGPIFFGSYRDMRDYSIEELDGHTPTASLVWERIGPMIVAPMTGRHIRHEVATWSTYAEAKAWLKSYLAPVAEETYFSPDGWEASK